MQQLTPLASQEAPLLGGPSSGGLGGASGGLGSSRRRRRERGSRPRLRGIRSRGSQRSNGVGTLEGVFFPCVSSILGAVLFVRMSWAVGEAGLIGVLLMLAAGTFVNVMTALSLAAISTNGTMKGGGAYFMISRSIGPELGVSVGVIFSLSLSVSTAFSLIAFAETVVNSFLCNDEVDDCTTFVENRARLSTLIASLTLLVITAAAATIGTAMSKFTNLITGVVMASVVLGIISLLFVPGGEAAPSGSRLAGNLWFDFSAPVPAPDLSALTAEDGQSFLGVFVIIFPAFTGITAGAGSSGKLKDPAASIGPGTLHAIAFTVTLYAVLMFVFALTLPRDTLKENRSIFKEECVVPGFIVVGILTCSLSSALGNIQGSARLLQSLARDGLVPALAPFTQGSLREDEPQVALALCWVVAQACLLYGRLDAIASLVTDCVLLVYIFLNLACFALRMTSAPNFRPRFAYFSWHTALAGALSALFIMFITSPQQGMLAFCMLAGLAYYVHVTAPVTPWGDVSQALIYHQVRKYLLRLDLRRSHPKFWRPSILFLPHYARGQLALLDFCNNLKKGGLYVVGNVLIARHREKSVLAEMPDFALACGRLKQLWVEFFAHTGAKAFHEVVLAPSLVSGLRSLLMTAGLGGLRPNTVCVQFYQGKSSSTQPATASSAASSSGAHLENAILDDTQQGHVRTSLSSPRSQYVSFGSSKASSMLDEINHLVATFAEDAPEESEDEAKISFCETLADILVFEKNLLVAEHFDQLNKELIMDYKRRRSAATNRKSRRFFFKSPTSFRFRFRISNSLATDAARVGVADQNGDHDADNDERGDSDADDAETHVSHDDDESEDIETGSMAHDSEVSSLTSFSTTLQGSPYPGEDGDADADADLEKFTTIDLWSTDESDWNDPSGTLALQMQLAFGLHRCDIWEDHTKLRVVAACPSVTHARGSEEARKSALMAYETLKKLLRAIRVEAEIIVLPAVGAALFEEHTVVVDEDSGSTDGRGSGGLRRVRRDPRTEPLTQLEHCAELNAMVQEHSGDKACVVFLPLPRPPSHSRITAKNASRYVENLQVLTQGLPPVILACPGSNIDPIVTTEL